MGGKDVSAENFPIDLQDKTSGAAATIFKLLCPLRLQAITRATLILVTAASLAASARAQSNLVYAVEFNQSNNRFGTINLLNGNFTQIATIGNVLINDIAYCPVDGTLYGIQNSSTLVTFNKTTGDITNVANFSVGGIESIAFRYSDGVLFGATQSGLYTIDPATGNATYVGSFNNPPNLNGQGQNIRFAQDGKLYVSNTSQNTDIYQIDTTSGSATWVGEAVGIPYLMLMNGDNYMYGVYISLGASPNAGPELVSFDLSSFAAGGTNADGSIHQISISMVGAGTNFPINFIFSGSVAQPVTTLTVPVSATSLEDQTGVVGDTVVFSTVASGTGPYSYVWSKDGTVIDGQTDSSLTLPNVGLGDAGTYSVIVGGAMGTVTNSATLTVNALQPPNLAIVLTNSVRVAWPAAAVGFVLQTNTDLTTTNWGDYTGPVDSVGSINSVTFEKPLPRLFFRLKH